ncbi:MAG: hypothetical protein WAN75_00705 [Xanthobacteraceae bacterium]
MIQAADSGSGVAYLETKAVKLAGVTASTTPFLTLNDGGTATHKSGSGTNTAAASSWRHWMAVASP